MQVNGKPDLFEINQGHLMDYKYTSVWSLIYSGEEGKIEWERQLNCYAWLLRKSGYTVNKLDIVVILRDWSKYNAKKIENTRNNKSKLSQSKTWDLPSKTLYYGTS